MRFTEYVTFLFP